MANKYFIPFHKNNLEFSWKDYSTQKESIKNEIYNFIIEWLECALKKIDNFAKPFLNFLNKEAWKNLADELTSFTFNRGAFYQKSGLRSAIIDHFQFIYMINKRFTAKNNADYIIFSNLSNLILSDETITKLNKIWNSNWKCKPKNIFIIQSCNTKTALFLNKENNKFDIDIIPSAKNNYNLLFQKKFFEIRDPSKTSYVISWTGAGDLKSSLSGWKTTPYKPWINKFNFIYVDPLHYFLTNNKKTSINKDNSDKSNDYKNHWAFHCQWINLCEQLLKNNGIIAISGTYHSIYICGSILQMLGFKIINDICWFKPNTSSNRSHRYLKISHETIIIAKKDNKKKHTFNYDWAKQYWNAKDPIKKQNRQMRTVWTITLPSKKEILYGEHPTQKPIELLKRLILSFTNEGDVILDPFMGSGTTGVVAKMYNRKFVGIEQEKKYFDLAVKRINKVKII